MKMDVLKYSYLINTFALPTWLVLGTMESTTRRSVLSTDRNARCKSICKDYFELELDKTFCRPALDLIPRPSIYQSCVMGRVAAFEHICIPTCMDYNSTTTTYDSHAVCKSEEKKQNPMAHVNWCRKAYDTTIPEISTIIAARSPYPKSTVKVTSTRTSQRTGENQNYNSEADNVIKGANEVTEENQSPNHVSDNHSFFSDFSSNSSDLITNMMQNHVNEKSNDTIVASDLGRQTPTRSNDHHGRKAGFNPAARKDEKQTYDVSGQSDATGEFIGVDSNPSSNLGQPGKHDDATTTSNTSHKDTFVEKRYFNSKAENDIKRSNEALDEEETTHHVSDNHSFVNDLSSGTFKNILVQKHVSEKLNDTMVASGMGRNAATAGSNDHHDDEVEFTNDSSELMPFKEAAKTEENPAYAISARSDALGESLVLNSSLSSNLGRSEDYDGAVAISRTLHQDSIVSINDGMQNLFHLQEEATVKHISNDTEKQEWKILLTVSN